MSGENLSDILNRPFHGGSRVTNCVVHMGIDWHDRPKSCENCMTDMANTLNYAIRVNEFLNQQIDDAKAAYAIRDSQKELVECLEELVFLKDNKTKTISGDEYYERKPIAWDKARAALAKAHSGQGEV